MGSGTVEPAVAPDVDEVVGQWFTVPDLAVALHTDVSRARQALRDLRVPLVRRGEHNVLSVPTAFVLDGHWVKGLAGLLNVLADGRFEANDALRWLFAADDTLPGTPIDALRENRGTEVRRRAQAMAL